MTADQSRQYCWLEAIGLFEQLRSGDYATARRLLQTSGEPEVVLDNFMRMIVVFLRGEEPEKMDRFVSAAYRNGPPPQPPTFARHS